MCHCRLCGLQTVDSCQPGIFPPEKRAFIVMNEIRASHMALKLRRTKPSSERRLPTGSTPNRSPLERYFFGGRPSWRTPVDLFNRTSFYCGLENGSWHLGQSTAGTAHGGCCFSLQVLPAMDCFCRERTLRGNSWDVTVLLAAPPEIEHPAACRNAGPSESTQHQGRQVRKFGSSTSPKRKSTEDRRSLWTQQQCL